MDVYRWLYDNNDKRSVRHIIDVYFIISLQKIAFQHFEYDYCKSVQLYSGEKLQMSFLFYCKGLATSSGTFKICYILQLSIAIPLRKIKIKCVITRNINRLIIQEKKTNLFFFYLILILWLSQQNNQGGGVRLGQRWQVIPLFYLPAYIVTFVILRSHNTFQIELIQLIGQSLAIQYQQH